MTKLDNDENMERALASYGERATTQNRRTRLSSLLGYTAAAGGLAFTGVDAIGAVVYNGTSRLYTATGANALIGKNTFGLDLDGVGGADLSFRLGARPFPQNFYAQFLGPGSVLANTTGTGQNFYSFARIFETFAANSRIAGFVEGSTGYLPFRFQGGTGTVGTQYGWLKVRFDVLTPGRGRMTIFASAFDNSGNTIQNGVTTGGGGMSGGGSNNVDSPATPLLALLGLGATGVATYRRRREAGLALLAAQGEQQAQAALADA